MKNLFKILLTLCFMVFVPLSTVSASDSTWKDPDYHFDKIKYLRLTQITIEEPNYKSFETTVAAANRVKYALKSALQKRGITLVDDNLVIKDNRDTFTTNEPISETNYKKAPKKAVVQPNAPGLQKKSLKALQISSSPSVSIEINALGMAKTYHEAWNENYVYYREITKNVEYRDYNGKIKYRKETITIPENRVRYHPAYTSTKAVADLTFYVRNPLDNNSVIYTDHDGRDRDFASDPDGMLGRICDKFAKNVSR